MAQALAEAEYSAKAGEVPVGALVLSGHGEVLGRAGNAVERLCDPTAHAEILAIRQACAKAGNHRLEGCCLCVTLEPCCMCAGAAVHARLAGLVYGAPDPGAGAVLSQADILDSPFVNHRVWHLGGILETECAALLRWFFSAKRQPYEQT